MYAEITWDLVMSEDMPFAEGCYRVEGGDWQVLIAVRADGHWPLGTRDEQWHSGVTGVHIVLPDDAKINSSTLLKLISTRLGVNEWREVRGPDSMVLR